MPYKRKTAWTVEELEQTNFILDWYQFPLVSDWIFWFHNTSAVVHSPANKMNNC